MKIFQLPSLLARRIVLFLFVVFIFFLFKDIVSLFFIFLSFINPFFILIFPIFVCSKYAKKYSEDCERQVSRFFVFIMMISAASLGFLSISLFVSLNDYWPLFFFAPLVFSAIISSLISFSGMHSTVMLPLLFFYMFLIVTSFLESFFGALIYKINIEKMIIFWAKFILYYSIFWITISFCYSLATLLRGDGTLFPLSS